MKPNQPQLPFMPRDWTQPQTVAGSELAAVLAEAQAAGYHAHRMAVLPLVMYRLQFWRLDAPQPTPEATANAIGQAPPTIGSSGATQHSGRPTLISPLHTTIF